MVGAFLCLNTIIENGGDSMESVELKESMEEITESIRKQGRELDGMIQRMILNDLKDINKRLKRIEDRWDEREKKRKSRVETVETVPYKKVTFIHKIMRVLGRK